MDTLTLVLIVLVFSYVLFPGFYADIGELIVLFWQQTKLEVRRHILFWGMHRQMEKDLEELRRIRDQIHSDD